MNNITQLSDEVLTEITDQLNTRQRFNLTMVNSTRELAECILCRLPVAKGVTLRNNTIMGGGFFTQSIREIILHMNVNYNTPQVYSSLLLPLFSDALLLLAIKNYLFKPP